MEKKSIAALIVTGAMVLGLSACGTNGATSDNADNSQSTSTPVVTEPVDTSSQTQEVKESTPTQAETTPVSQEETQPTAQPQEETPKETPVPEEVGPKFIEVNETVYATTSVNVRSSYSADSDKVGGLFAGASATRTGVGDNGWSRIVYGDSVAYVNSSYLTTTKPASGNPDPGSEQTTKPSTQTSSTSKPSTQTPSTQTPSTSKPSTQTPSTQTPSTQTPSTQTPSTQTPSTYLPGKDEGITEEERANAEAFDKNIIDHGGVILDHGAIWVP